MPVRYWPAPFSTRCKTSAFGLLPNCAAGLSSSDSFTSSRCGPMIVLRYRCSSRGTWPVPPRNPPAHPGHNSSSHPPFWQRSSGNPVARAAMNWSTNPRRAAISLPPVAINSVVNSPAARRPVSRLSSALRERSDLQKLRSNPRYPGCVCVNSRSRNRCRTWPSP